MPTDMLLLPQEVIEQVCEHLSLKDVVGLRQTNRHFRRGISDALVKEKLLEECPWYRVEYSQFQSWEESGASHVTENAQKPCHVLVDRLHCPLYTDLPLPRDFTALCTDVERTFAWDYNNKGICFDEKQLDLSETNTDFSVPCNYGVSFSHVGTTIKYHGFGVTVVGKMIQARHTSRAIAAISVHQEQLTLTVKYPNQPAESLKLNCKPPLRLQVISDCVYVFGRHDHTSVLYLVTPHTCQEILHAQRKCPPAGMVLYNGQLFNVDMDGRYRCTVSPATLRISFDRNRPPDRFHRVYQDEKQARFCLIYKSTGLVTGLVDLQQKQTVILSQISADIFAEYNGATDREDHLLMVGLSQGKVGCWRYTLGYLQQRYKSQHGQELPKELKKVLKEKGVSLEQEDALGRFPGKNSELAERV